MVVATAQSIFTKCRIDRTRRTAPTPGTASCTVLGGWLRFADVQDSAYAFTSFVDNHGLCIGAGAMQHSRERRRKYFVDSQVQAAILRQAAGYWLFGTIIYTLVVAIFRIIPYCFSSQGMSFSTVWYHLAPMVISSAVLLPIVILSALRFSHRFVGPMIRFRQVLKQLARGEKVPPVVLRRNDFWQEVAHELTEVSARLAAASAEEPEKEQAVLAS